MKRFLLSMLIGAMALVADAQSTFMGQCVNLMKSSGDSISLDLQDCASISPQVKDGKIVWNINLYVGEEVASVTEEDVTSIEYRSEEQIRKQVREALVEFYKATNGDKWSNNTNWCSNKPIDEWFGVTKGSDLPYIQGLDLSGNNLSGKLPSTDCLQRMVGLNSLHLWENNIGGSIPNSLQHVYTLERFMADNNKFTGEIPKWLCDLPRFSRLEVGENDLTGSIPSNVSRLMDHDFLINLSGNDLSGKVPNSVLKHPRFSQLWDYIIPQRGHLEMPDIPGPVVDVEDVNGNHFSTSDIYKENKFTLLFNYSSSTSGFTDKVAKAYESYKSKGFEVLGMIPGNREAVMSYLRENNINWLNLDPEGFSSFYNRYFLYLNYVNLVDENGNIVFSSLMDETGKMEKTGWKESSRDQLLFDVLKEKFGKIDYNLYTSTDYSHDGEVMTLQKATKGKGVDIVFVGNGFVDKDMEPNGKYEKVMKAAMEQFFVYEPYTSLRDRFNVYAVKAVSPNKEFFDEAKNAIHSDEDAFAYAQKIKTLIPNRPMRVNVIANSYNAGRSVCFMFDDASYVAFMLDGVSKVLNHEGGGHGVGRLLDEYVEDNQNSTPSKEAMQNLETLWKELGRGANVDLHSDVTQTRWSHLAADKRYASEGLGSYEGAATYGRNVYRPTQNSMMRFNDTPFNAPSREAIYRYVMQESEGSNWKYDYETFVAFDQAGRKQATEAKRAPKPKTIRGMNEREIDSSRHLPPVFVSGSWQDAMKK